ncbi:unknown [Anaerotruncus sp. CAG:390]|nr:unknown [Anaerotruncus sp. CAG:390]
MTHAVVIALEMLLHAAKRFRLSRKSVALGTQPGEHCRSVFAALSQRGKRTAQRVGCCRKLCRLGIVSRNGLLGRRAFGGKSGCRTLIVGYLFCRCVFSVRSFVFGAPDKLKPRRGVRVVRLRTHDLVKSRRYRVLKRRSVLFGFVCRIALALFGADKPVKAPRALERPRAVRFCRRLFALGKRTLCLFGGTRRRKSGFRVTEVVFRHLDLAFKRKVLTGTFLDLAEELFRLRLARPRQFAEMLVLCLKRFKRFRHGVKLVRGKLELVLAFGYLAAQIVGIVEPELNIGFLFYRRIFKISFCFYAFALKRTEPPAYLVYDILRALHVVLSRGKPTLRLVLFMTVFRNARGILEYAAPLIALAGDDVGDPPLTDYGVTVSSDAGIEKHLIDVAQANLLAVYEVFAVAAAVVTPRDGDLVVRAIYPACLCGVVKGDRHLRISHPNPQLSPPASGCRHRRR